uniref:CSON008297 protein n=1 Tax=Culicoides sonorensis TaxID=179676 RepID=A0A336LBT2_CULSO
MEKPKPPTAVSKPVSIVPKTVFGLRTDVLGNIHFDSQQTVIYPVSGVLAFQDVAKYPAIDTNLIDLTKIPEGEELIAQSTEEIQAEDHQDVLCITNFEKGFTYALHNIVHVYEKDTTFKFQKRTIITIPITLYEKESYRIVNMAVNAQQDTVIATTLHSQIYIAPLFPTETLKIIKIQFETLGEPLHIDNIIGVSCCAWKSIIMTASKDQTIRIWNYETMKIELVKKYQLKISVMALHPAGTLAAIGFSDSLRFLQVQLDDLKVTKVFNYPNCSKVEFSHQGHLLAAAHGKIIVIIAIFTFEIIHVLKGHNGNILSLVWSQNDSKLVSSGKEGSIYEWDTLSGKRINEIVQKGVEYRCLALSNDATSIFAITNNGILREIVKSDVIREFKTPDQSPVNSVALARSDLIMFLGTEMGQLYDVHCPLGETGGGTFTNFRFFHQAVTNVRITYDDKLLVTSSTDGTLVIWKILNIEGKTAPMDSVLGTCTDVMAPRADLLVKNNTIKNLEKRMQEQVEEFHFKIQHGDVFHSEQLRDVHKSYCKAIQELKDRYDEMVAKNIEEVNQMNVKFAKIEEEHQREIMNMEANFNEKIITEYDKSAMLKRKMDEMKEEYELKLRKSSGCLQDTIEALENNFKKQLQERQDIIQEIMKEIDNQKAEFVEYCKQVEIDNDRNIVETQLNYEKRLKEEEENSVKWRGEAGVLQKKIVTVSEQADQMKKEVHTLKQQQQRSQATIKDLQREIDVLNQELQGCDGTIREKEKKYNELQKKNVELEKSKQILNYKINELKAQIEPLEQEIIDKKNYITEMEKELEGLQQSHKQLTLRLSKLNDKHEGTAAELKKECQRRRTATAQFARICGEIHELAQYIQKPNELKQAIIDLYQKYADDKEVQKMLQVEAQIKNEFMRQREHIEKLSSGSKVTQDKKKEVGGTTKLLKENIVLTTELNKLRSQLRDTRKQVSQMESVLGLSGKYLPVSVARERLNKAVMSADMIEQRFKDEIDQMKQKIKILQDENLDLRDKILEKQ